MIGVLTLVAQAIAIAQPVQAQGLPSSRSRSFAAATRLEIGEPTASKEARLVQAISQSAMVSIAEHGIAAARQALLDCQKGDYPGGGMGIMSLPFQRPSAATDHCRR